MNSEMTKTVLGHTLNSDTGKHAAYAAVGGALTIRDDIQERDTAMMASIWSDIINLIMIRNGYGDTARPRPVAYRPGIVDANRAQRDQLLSSTGVKFKKKYFMNAYHLAEDDIEDVTTVITPTVIQDKKNKQQKLIEGGDDSNDGS